jgi:site-specific DNA-methyltransferase (adenine-specific)
MNLKLERLAISNLTFDPSNARKHSNKNIAAIAGSLKQFGQRKPIVVTGDGVIVAGNGTVEAALFLGWSDIDVVRVPKDWDADRIKAFALADNRTAELAEWDADELSKQLTDLIDVGFDVSDFGFSAEDTSILEIETHEDEAPEPPAVPVTNLGDVWQLGKHRLVCGDSTDSNVLALALDGQLADCVLTDPPYNVAYEGGTKDKLTIQNDDMSEEDFDKFLAGFYSAALANTRAGGPIYVFHPDSGGELFRRNMKTSGWLFKQCLIWAKDSLVLGRQDYNWQHEPILYGWKPGAAHSWYGPFTNTTLVELSKSDFGAMSREELLDLVTDLFDNSSLVRDKKPRRNALHPTMKPISLVGKLLKNSCARGGRVLDPFGGSGSTLIACEQLGLTAALVELDPKYCDVIVARWEAETGAKGVRV